MGKNSKSTDKILDEREAEHAIKNYTRVPNMLVDGYKDLHPQDKWLYVCLVRLCGKEGTRYLSLRYIAERTGFSPSVLSDDKKRGKPGMIRRLHNAGLIHAEIKRRHTPDGKEEKNAQYHITVTDTWKLNYDFFYSIGETCSESEQDDKEPVLIPNATCSESEQDKGKPVLNQNGTCSDSGTIVILQDKITDSSKITEVRDSDPSETTTTTSVANATPTHSLSSQSLFSSEDETKLKAPSKKKEKKAEPSEPKGPPEMPPADMPWGTKKCLLKFDAWRGRILIGHYKLTQASSCAKGLAEQYTEQEVEQVHKLMNESPYWQERGGADICDVASQIHKEIRKSQTAKANQQSLAKQQGSQQPVVSAQLSREKSQRNLERLRQRALASGNYSD